MRKPNKIRAMRNTPGSGVAELKKLPGWSGWKPGLARIDRLRALAPEAFFFFRGQVAAQQL
jgi:hypothetical protein